MGEGRGTLIGTNYRYFFWVSGNQRRLVFPVRLNCKGAGWWGGGMDRLSYNELVVPGNSETIDDSPLDRPYRT